MAVLSDQINLGEIPKHVAVIMDGNGRWAESRNAPRIEGHRQGAHSVRRIVEESCRLGIRYLTLFSFSTENWNRSKAEVSALMQLFEKYLDSELKGLIENGIRLRAIGDFTRLPKAVRLALERSIEKTANNTTLDLVLAVSYSGRSEIVEAAKRIAHKVAQGEINPEDINSELFSHHLWSAGIPDPDLLIRTSGELRISNFLLWQLAYSEIVVTEEYWPDFNEQLLRRCVAEYQNRDRRFGLTRDQLEKQQTRTARPSAV
jgi:undecaprenyl diphosphate synthase